MLSLRFLFWLCCCCCLLSVVLLLQLFAVVLLMFVFWLSRSRAKPAMKQNWLYTSYFRRL